MTLLSRSIRSMLSANFEHCMQNPKFDPLPLVRLFNPMGRAVWLVTEIYADDDTLFGLCEAQHNPNYVDRVIMLSWPQNAAGWL